MPVPAEYKFTIAATYTLTAADNTEIAAGKAAKLKWGKGYPVFKAAIRAHLKLQQSGRCAFCRLRVPTGMTFSNLEHLVGKTKYSQFEFLPQNLVYSCHRCNFSKVAKPTLTAPNANPATQTYPINSAGFTIINPYHDPYENHIDFLDGVIITSANNSSKGKNTIDLYGLTRVELAEDRASDQKLNQQSLNKQMVVRLTDPTTDQAIINQINAIIANLPTWTL
jgi:uncharacterized protein (TIGR02646 family)